MPRVVFDDEETTTRVDVCAVPDGVRALPDGVRASQDDVPTMRERPAPRPVTLPPMRPPAHSGVLVRSEPVTLSLDDPRRELEPWEEERTGGT